MAHRLKNLERAWRRLCIRAIARAMGGAGAGGSPDWSARSYRLLFLRHDRIGDMILSTSVLEAIARSHPTITLDVLSSRANAPVLRGAPFVGSVIVFDRKRPLRYLATVLRLRRSRYDAVIDCMVTAPSLTTLLLMLASGARHRIGVARPGNEFAYTIPIAPLPWARHMVEQLATLAVPFGVDPATRDWRPVISLTPEETRTAEQAWRGEPEGEVREVERSAGAEERAPRVLVNISAGTQDRRWPVELYQGVVRHARQRWPCARILVVSAPDELERARTIAVDGAEAFDTHGIRGALALVATADLVVTPGTSIAHAASAFRTPTVAMYPRASVEGWGVYRTAGRNVPSPGAWLDSLPLERVTEAMDATMDERAKR